MEKRSQTVDTNFFAPRKRARTGGPHPQSEEVETEVQESESRSSNSTTVAATTGPVAEAPSSNDQDDDNDDDNATNQPDLRRRFRDQWKTNRPWLQCSDDRLFMWCSLCRSARRTGKWGSESVTTMKLAYVVKHEIGEQHKDLERKLALKNREKVDKTRIAQAFGTIEEGALFAFQHLFRFIYWLCLEEVALAKFNSLRELMLESGIQGLDILNKKNASYTSADFVREAVFSISEVIKNDTVDILKSGKWPFAIMVDECVDEANISELAIYLRGFDPVTKSCVTHFADIRPLENGSAECVEEVTRAYLRDNNIDMLRLASFNSDGCSVMIGSRSGVGQRLRQDNPFLLTYWCLNHRLALACRDASEGIVYLKNQFRPTCLSLFLFYDNSAVRSAALRLSQRVIGDDELKPRKPADTRWLVSSPTRQPGGYVTARSWNHHTHAYMHWQFELIPKSTSLSRNRRVLGSSKLSQSES